MPGVFPRGSGRRRRSRPRHRAAGAVYGTSSKSCEATRFVARRADGKQSYSFEVTNRICGDPAFGERKSLDVSYYCGEIAKTASAYEHRTVSLSCPMYPM